VITNSAFTGSNVQKIYSVKPVVCHLGIPMEEEASYNIGDYLAVLTTFRPAKNVQNVIKAVELFLKRSSIKDFKLKIAGQGDGKKDLEHMANDLGISQNVEFCGRLSDEDLPGFFRNARALAYCPIDEPFGLVPLEALARKTPVIVSNHGGPAETVEHEVTGLHVNPFDPEDIAAAIERIWKDSSKAKIMAEAGWTKTRDYFSFDAFIKRFELIALHS